MTTKAKVIHANTGVTVGIKQTTTGYSYLCGNCRVYVQVKANKYPLTRVATEVLAREHVCTPEPVEGE